MPRAISDLVNVTIPDWPLTLVTPPEPTAFIFDCTVGDNFDSSMELSVIAVVGMELS
ncbi:MAG: hypothetical protein ABIQ04_03535 [Candidatus Saccharimonadales bacterium]